LDGTDRYIEIISTQETIPFSSVVEATYRLNGEWLDVEMESLAFLGGEQSWANVLPMETLLETDIGHISWKASADLAVEHARIAVSIFGKCHDLLPFEFKEVSYGDGSHIVFSTNTVREEDVLNALYWLYASRDSSMSLSNGVLTIDGIPVAENNYLTNFEEAFRFVVSRMNGSFSVLGKEQLDIINANSKETIDIGGHNFYVYKYSTLTEELINAVKWGVSVSISDIVELDMSGFEPSRYCLVNGKMTEFFYSTWTGNKSEFFGDNVCPVVKDINSDGLFDIIVVSSLGVHVYLNIGDTGSPSFASANPDRIGLDALVDTISSMRRPIVVPSNNGMLVSDGGAEVFEFNLSTMEISASGKQGLPVDIRGNLQVLCPNGFVDITIPDGASRVPCMDVPVQGGQFISIFGDDLLCADSEGAIWYYERVGENKYEFRNKSFAGTYPGFAQGLTVAAVDWDDDGDLDCLAGTADGKLMLLRDPKVGRPTNLKAFAGVDNILLTWDPNQQSRIRGYRVYRALPEQAGESSAGTRIAQPPLPTYRDFPPTTDEYAYKVSSVSRFYTAGNSTPTETESPATEAILARTGGVKFFWNDAVAKVGEKVEVMLSIENSMNYNVAGKSQTVVYDPAYLEPVKVVKTGLTEEFDIVDSHPEQGGASPSGSWQITIESGALGDRALPAGGGKFLVLVFEAKKEGVTKVGGETGATVSIAARSVIAPYQLGDVDGDGDVDVEDLRLLAKLKNGTGRKHTANQLKAGDFNGNGKLDNADYQALWELLKEKGLL
jgi:hypothetical protein